MKKSILTGCLLASAMLLGSAITVGGVILGSKLAAQHEIKTTYIIHDDTEEEKDEGEGKPIFGGPHITYATEDHMRGLKVGDKITNLTVSWGCINPLTKDNLVLCKYFFTYRSFAQPDIGYVFADTPNYISGTISDITTKSDEFDVITTFVLDNVTRIGHGSL